MPNALAGETSPYLLQHADNPVQWHPWSEEALERARRENRPILLSIGYSACHWCHVMAHESFEDEETARLMNELFINIKVDREERPDLDRIYQTAHQLLARRGGGWPLTMFLTPDDQTPFFGGTYFPLESRFGLPSFKELLVRVSGFHRENADAIREQNASLVAALQSIDAAEGPPGTTLNAEPLDGARKQLQANFDEAHGGFGGAPKFPHPTSLERLMRHYAATAAAGTVDEAALEMATFTLRRMALGGLYDQLGGGFCRYSVDAQWMIPHFEKMLYDNGPLLDLCARAWQLTGDPLFRRATAETAAWVMREMQSPDGGYYSTLDADSEGEEGRYYLWEPEQARALLDEREYALLSARFGLDRPPNFEGHAWHLHVFDDVPLATLTDGLDEDAAQALLDRAREKLYEAREQRVRPGRDEKILASWNGLMIRGMAVAGLTLGAPDILASAERALDFVKATLWRDGRLLATCKDGRAHLMAYLDDHALLIDGILHLLQARWRDGDLAFAVELAEVLLERFRDAARGGFYFTADDHERLIHRPRPMGDDSLPSGNAVAARVLGRLGHLLGETRYLDAAEETVRAAWGPLSEYPHAHNAMLDALEEQLLPPQTIIVRGTPEAMQPWVERCTRRYAPRRLTFAIPTSAGPLPEALAARAPRGDVVAYVCEGTRCGPPVTSLEALEDALEATEAPATAPG